MTTEADNDKTTQPEKDLVLQWLDHATADIAAARRMVAQWPVDNGTTPPVIVSFTAQPAVLPPGGGVVTLTWGTTNAARVEITSADGVFDERHPANGSSDFTITQNTLFELDAFADETDNNFVSATLTVAVQQEPLEGPPQILLFTATPDTLPAGGGTATLSWQTANATLVVLGETAVAPSDSITQHVGASALYTLKAVGVGPIATATADISVAPPVQTGAYMPAVPRGISSFQPGFSPKADYYKDSDLPGYIPFSCFDDPDFGIIARGAEGKVLQKRRLHVNGATWQTYGPVSVIEDGKIVQRWDKHTTDAGDWLANQLRLEKPRLGKRGEGYPGPYFTAHAHPNAITKGSLNSPTWVCLRMDGVVFGIMPTGDNKLMMTLDQTVTAYHDFTLTDDPSTFFVTCAYEGKIRRITRDALNIVSEEDFATGLGFVTSVRYLGGMLYAADNHGHRIHKINATAIGKTNPGLRAVLSTGINSPFWIDRTEDPDKIVVLSSLNTDVYYVDVNTGEKSANIFFPDETNPAAHIPFGFGTVSCDWQGNFGPKGNLVVAITATTWGGTNNTVYHYRAEDSTPTHRVWDFSPFHSPNPDRPGENYPLLGVGRGQEPGHYLWGCEYHCPPVGKGQGIMLVWGHSQTAANTVRIVLPNDPPEDSYEIVGNSDPGYQNRQNANHGLQFLTYGAPATVPVGKYPSAMCVFNSSMWGIVNGDYFGSLSNDARKEFIYGGFLGIHPRPEFMNDDYATWSIGYELLTNSQEWLRRGTACTDEWRAAFPADMKPVVIGTDSEGKPITLPPIPSYNSHYLHAYKEGDALVVYLQDKDTGQHPIPSGTVIELYKDYGSPWQQHLATVQGTGTNTVRWPGPINLPPGRYGLAAIAGRTIGEDQATIMDV